jgi:hypothetical protein
MVTGVQRNAIHCDQCQFAHATEVILGSLNQRIRECPRCGWRDLREPRRDAEGRTSTDRSGLAMSRRTQVGFGTWKRTSTDRTIVESGSFTADCTDAQKQTVADEIRIDPHWETNASYVTQCNGGRAVTYLLGSNYMLYRD